MWPKKTVSSHCLKKARETVSEQEALVQDSSEVLSKQTVYIAELSSPPPPDTL